MVSDFEICDGGTQNGGGWDQKPFSVHTIEDSPTTSNPSSQEYIMRSPTAYLPCLDDASVSNLPFLGTMGSGQ